MKLALLILTASLAFGQTVTDTIISPIGQVAGLANIVSPQGHTEGPSVVKLEHGPWNYSGSAFKQLPLTLPGVVVGQVSDGSTLTTLTTWINTSHGVEVDQYNLSPTPATQSQQYTLGTANSQPSGIIGLPSGAIVAAWYENASTGDGHIDFRFGYLKNGTWTTLNVSAPQSTPSTLKVRMGIALHPDGTIWAFFKHDGFSEIGAIHLQEGASSLSLLAVNSIYITQASDGINGPNSEYPFLALAPDASTNSLLLAYQRNEEHVFQNSPFLKGATLAIQRISTSGTHTLVNTLPQWVERVSPFSLSLAGGIIQIAFPVIDQVALNVNSLLLGTLTASTWTYTPFLSGILSPPNQTWFTNRTDRVELIIGTTDGKLHQTTATTSSVSTCTPDATGWVVTGLTAAQNNLLGPLICSGASPWVYGDAAESATADNMAPAALAEVPTLGAALTGTVSWTAGTNTITTTVDQTGALSPGDYIVLAWNSIDGAGTGRQIQQVSSVTATTITTQTNNFAPTSSGITAYHISSVPDSHGWTFLSWTQGQPAVTWNYYDVAIALYRLYYRTGNVQYQTWARAYADITWQWTLDHGYTYVYPRASSMISQFFRALDGHSERLPGLYLESSTLMANFGNSVQFCPYCDNREAGYAIWWMALGAKNETDATRHTAYCSALTTYVPYWNSVQQPDGSFGENEYAINAGFVSAVKAFAAPFIYQGAPWREAINVKALEAAYESLNDTSSQGCDSTALAATTLATITKAVTWQNNYGRDTSNRGIFYEVNSQSADQESIAGTGTVSITLGSNVLTGVGTNFLSTIAAYPFIGIASPNDPRTVYKRASCSDNTHCLLTVNFGLFGEASSVSGSTYGLATPAKTGCHSSATYCYGAIGDRNLTRTVCGGIAWLYAQTLNSTYKSWSDECVSAQLGGPTAGLTSADNIGAITLPCSGPACDGWVTDTVTSAPSCYDTGNVSPCVYGGALYGNLGKNYGEAFGAPGIDNALAWRLLGAPTAPIITSISPLPAGIVGTPYSYTFTASGTTPITWSATGLPAWAALSPTGIFSGTPSAAATTVFNVTASNTAGSAGPSPFSITITGGPTPTCSPRTHVTPPNVLDIQLQTNMALGTVACTNSLTGSGCTVVDVQRVVNASLGAACVIGP